MQFEDGFPEIYQGIIMIDSQEFIVAANKAARELLGIENEIVGKEARSLLPATGMYRVLETGKPVLHEKVQTAGRILVFYHQPVFEGFALSGVVTSFQDLSDYEKLAYELEAVKEVNGELEALKELNSELEAVFNSSFDEIFVTDGQGYTLRVNQAGERYYGVKAADIIGKNVSELEEQGLFTPSISLQVIKKKKRLTLTQTTKNGQKLIVTGNPVFDAKGEIIRVVTNSWDITELSDLRRRLEETERLMDSYRSQIVKLQKERINETEVISKSVTMQNILELAEKVAGVNSTVLIEGESGAGKGVIALKIHQFSQRSEKPFITVNCGAIPENLIESELFGYEAGAFTGAKKEGKKGLFELANGGTIFLDEISELPINLQVKLLHVVQERKLMRIGGGESVEIDVRIIAATNRNIKKLISENRFREDLYYRLNVIPLVIPPLRHRQEDIPAFVDYFLDLFAKKYGLCKKMSLRATEYLSAYHWPGNVRELENLIERLVVTVDSPEILPAHLPDFIFQVEGGLEKIFVLDVCSLKSATEEMERQLLHKAMVRFHTTYRMADALEVNQSTIVRKLHRYGIIKDKAEIEEMEPPEQGKKKYSE